MTTTARTSTGPLAPGGGTWPLIAAGGSLTAGALHVVAAVDHSGAGWWVTGFFGAVAAAQLAAGAALLVGPRLLSTRRRTSLATALLAGTVGLLLLYLVVHGTEWLGALAGSHADTTSGAAADHAVRHEGPVGTATTGAVHEPAEPVALALLAVQAVVVPGCVALLPDSRRPRVTNLLLALAVVVCLLWLTGPLA